MLRFDKKFCKAIIFQLKNKLIKKKKKKEDDLSWTPICWSWV